MMDMKVTRKILFEKYVKCKAWREYLEEDRTDWQRRRLLRVATFDLRQMVRQYLWEARFLRRDVDLVDSLEQFDGVQILGQVGQKLSRVNKVHFQKRRLVQFQNACILYHQMFVCFFYFKL